MVRSHSPFIGSVLLSGKHLEFQKNNFGVCESSRWCDWNQQQIWWKVTKNVAITSYDISIISFMHAKSHELCTCVRIFPLCEFKLSGNRLFEPIGSRATMLFSMENQPCWHYFLASKLALKKFELTHCQEYSLTSCLRSLTTQALSYHKYSARYLWVHDRIITSCQWFTPRGLRIME